ncbi:MAG: hypothetical protein VYD22_02885 [Gemmatimonadota bacterium]|nr:hypothetical protein [Gemmatimonadota bacterium]
MYRSKHKLFGIPCCLILLGCDIPTAMPILEQRWILPLEQAKIGVEELLPAGVSLKDGVLEVSIDTITTSSSLNTMCVDCAALNGSTVAVPAFTSSFNGSVDLPANISSVEISSGSVHVAVTNGLSFDPLAGGGSIEATILDGEGGLQLAQLIFSGALAPGTSLAQSISIGNSNVGNEVFAVIEVISPGGQIAPLNTSEELSVATTGNALIMGSTTVSLEGHAVEVEVVKLDLDHIGPEIIERIVNGSLILEVTNPFGVSLSGNINIGPTSKSFLISEDGRSTTTISYTRNELSSFLGEKGVTLSLSGTANGTSITLSSHQELSIEGTIDCLIRIG